MTDQDDPTPTAAQSIPPTGRRNALAIRKETSSQRAALSREVERLNAQHAAEIAELEAQRKAFEAALAQRKAALAEQMRPLREKLAQMHEVLWTVDLYLGRGETLQLLCDGEPAAEDAPIVIRQRVLVMAEESLVLLDRDRQTGMDYRNIDTFVSWLRESPDNLDRLLPFDKGVVVLVPTRVTARSGNAFEDAARNAANSSSYWLLRNGQRLYLLTVDSELTVTDRVFPQRREFLDIFDPRVFGAQITVQPGSSEWLRLEKKADQRRRHFMRIMMVLQGIIDRTAVWLPTFPAGINLLSVAAQDDGKVVLLEDDDDSIALSDGRESFADYQRRLNKRLRPGLRVIGDWSNRGPDDDKRGRIHPNGAQGLRSDVPYLLEERRAGGFVFRFTRTDKVWRSGVPVPGQPGYVYTGRYPTTPRRRASYLVRPGDSWVLPYDLVTTAELERFLASRDERSTHFLSMVPTIKAALAAKHAEAEQERPFRVLLRGMLIADGADDRDVDDVLDDLVHWWKLNNTWSKPLNGEPDHEARAVREITAEHAARRAAVADHTRTARMVAAGRSVPGAICVAQRSQGRWYAYAPSAEGDNVFLDVTAIHPDGTAGITHTWVKVAQRSASRMNVAWSDPRWDDWDFAANPNHYLTGPEREALIADVRGRAAGIVLAIVEFHDPRNPGVRGFASYAWTRDTPETAPTRISGNPLSWRHETDDDRMITMLPYRVIKKNNRSRLEPGNLSDGYREVFSTSWAGYSASTPYGDVPWWPAQAHTYAEARPALVWSDEDALARMNRWRLRCVAAWEEQRARRDRISTLAYRYVGAVDAIIIDRLTAEARERFVADYGTDADDLWESHLASLNLTNPIHPRTVWGIIAQRLDRGDSPVGATLGELAEETWRHGNRTIGEWHPEPGVQDLGAYAQLVVPALDDEDCPREPIPSV